MKTATLLLSAMMFVAVGAQAQTETSKTTTSNTTAVQLPDWGVAGADNARYYYLPDLEMYYDVRTAEYVRYDNGNWVRSMTLPDTYKNVDLYDTYKVVWTDPTEPFPQYDKMKIKYAKGYKGEPQKTVKIKKRADGTVKIKENSI